MRSSRAGAPARQSLGAHTFYVPAQLFETASGYLALFVTHDEFWRRLGMVVLLGVVSFLLGRAILFYVLRRMRVSGELATA